MYGKQACAEWIRFFWKESPSNTLAIRSFDISNTQSHNLKDLWPTTWVSSYSYSVKGTAQRFQRWGRSMSCSPLGLGQVETWHHDTPVFPSPKPLARDISCKGPESVWTRWVLSETARSWNLRQTMTDNRNCSWHLLKNMKLLICGTKCSKLLSQRYCLMPWTFAVLSRMLSVSVAANSPFHIWFAQDQRLYAQKWSSFLSVYESQAWRLASLSTFAHPCAGLIPAP